MLKKFRKSKFELSPDGRGILLRRGSGQKIEQTAGGLI